MTTARPTPPVSRRPRKAAAGKKFGDRARLHYIAIRLEELSAERTRLKEERVLLKARIGAAGGEETAR